MQYTLHVNSRVCLTILLLAFSLAGCDSDAKGDAKTKGDDSASKDQDSGESKPAKADSGAAPQHEPHAADRDASRPGATADADQDDAATSGATTSPEETGSIDASLSGSDDSIGPLGGQLTTDDGTVSLDIPAGALDTDVALTIANVEPPPNDALLAIDLGPNGTQFNSPVTITISYAELGIDSSMLERLELARLTAGTWESLPDSALNSAAQTVSATTEHFSTYGLVAQQAEEPGVDPGGPSPTIECQQNQCGEGCGCDPELAGASCQMGTAGMPGCIRCECDGTMFTCNSCEDGAEPAPAPSVPSEPEPTAGCDAVISCDQHELNSSCQEYDATTSAESIMNVCVGGTYADAPCDHRGSSGGCRQDTEGGGCMVIWYYAPNFTTVEQVQQNCADNGHTYVAP